MSARTPGTSQGLYPEVEGETDYNHMLNGVGLDAVVIATSVRFHHPMAKASLLAGKHTFIEKPMAASSAECEELVAIAREKGLVLMTATRSFIRPPFGRSRRSSIRVISGRSAISPRGA